MAPGFFGIKYSNRDFNNEKCWGKNQFNSSFPAALACFIFSKKKSPIYLKTNSTLQIDHTTITDEELFGKKFSSEDLYFSFEDVFESYAPIVAENVISPRIDLVTRSRSTKKCLKALEVKLTALPDSSTCDLSESEYGSEIVVRPDTIVYLAYAIAEVYKSNRSQLKRHLLSISRRVKDWTSEREIIDNLDVMIHTFNRILVDKNHLQKPYILQPIWKTKGKVPELHNNCLDLFVWSDFAFTRLFVSKVQKGKKDKVDRPIRALVWVTKMLYDFSTTGRVDHIKVLRECNFNQQTDKAFAINGKETNPFLKNKRLERPLIKQNEIKKIILGGGEKFLSPERRFDALLYYTDGLFDK